MSVTQTSSNGDSMSLSPTSSGDGDPQIQGLIDVMKYDVSIKKIDARNKEMVKKITRDLIFKWYKFILSDDELKRGTKLYRLLFSQLSVKEDEVKERFWDEYKSIIPQQLGKKRSSVTNMLKLKCKGTCINTSIYMIVQTFDSNLTIDYA